MDALYQLSYRGRWITDQIVAENTCKSKPVLGLADTGKLDYIGWVRSTLLEEAMTGITVEASTAGEALAMIYQQLAREPELRKLLAKGVNEYFKMVPTGRVSLTIKPEATELSYPTGCSTLPPIPASRRPCTSDNPQGIMLFSATANRIVRKGETVWERSGL